MAEPQKTLYEILGVPTGASRPEIQRAYLEMKSAGKADSKQVWELERAYVTLSDPNAKRKYDQELREGSVRAAVRAEGRPAAPVPAEKWTPRAPDAARIPRLPVAIALGVILIVVLWRFTWPYFSWRLVNFEPGAQLLERSSGRPYGKVLGYESAHRFPNGVVARAYRVERQPGQEQWLSREEVNQLARPAR